MSDDPLNFSDLVGQVKPIKRKCNHPQFNRVPKVRHIRKIESQHARGLFYTKNKEDLALNLDSINAHAFNAMKSQQVRHTQTIDLHGLYVDDAIRLLADKLSERNNRQLEYWMVVHGKGRNSPQYDRAPLKDAVLDFLLNHSAVAALTSIKDKDQRSGAVMIAVQKKSVF